MSPVMQALRPNCTKGCFDQHLNVAIWALQLQKHQIGRFTTYRANGIAQRLPAQCGIDFAPFESAYS